MFWVACVGYVEYVEYVESMSNPRLVEDKAEAAVLVRVILAGAVRFGWGGRGEIDAEFVVDGWDMPSVIDKVSTSCIRARGGNMQSERAQRTTRLT